jgi:two-component system CheB/CheR fusion protein
VLDSHFGVVYANQAFYKNFKVSKKETENTSFFELGNHQWDVPKMREFLKKILPQKKFFNGYEIDHNFPKIGQRTMRINARQVADSDQREKYILVAIEDVTEEKRLLAVMLRANKLSAIGQLTMGIAHGLNSPLTGIYNFLHVYYKQEKKGTEKSKELKLMLDACVYMSGLISGLSYFAPENKKEFAPVDMLKVIDSVLLFTKRQFLADNIKIVKDLPRGPLNVNGNNVQLQHMLLNIILNAKEAIKRDGQITIRAEKNENRLVTLEIIDTGHGVSINNLKKMFLPFFTTKHEHGHIGMGLAAALEVAKNHGGVIKISNIKKGGVKVTINLLALKK